MDIRLSGFAVGNEIKAETEWVYDEDLTGGNEPTRAQVWVLVWESEEVYPNETAAQQAAQAKVEEIVAQGHTEVQ
jgi:hypothetical protein